MSSINFEINVPNNKVIWSEDKVRSKLEELGNMEGKKVAWIRDDLSIKKSNWLTRVIWTVVAKHFSWMRKHLYKVNLKQSRVILEQIGKEITPQSSELTIIYKQAVEKFNQTAPRHALVNFPHSDFPSINQSGNNADKDLILDAVKGSKVPFSFIHPNTKWVKSTIPAWGERKPIKEFPEWVTLEVQHGGFATNKCLAKLEDTDTTNESFLTHRGIDRLNKMLESGCYKIEYPEHGALLVYAWLKKTGEDKKAEELLDQIKPFFGKIRFYPKQSTKSTNSSLMVSKCNVSELEQSLLVKLNEQNELLNLQINELEYPITKLKLLALFSQTIECEHFPEFELEGKKKQVKRVKINETDKKKDKRVYASHPDCVKHTKQHGCGWPLQKVSEEWLKEAKKVYDSNKIEIDKSQKEYKNGTTMHTLCTIVQKCAQMALKETGVQIEKSKVEGVTSKEVTYLRSSLAGWKKKQYDLSLESKKGINYFDYLNIQLKELENKKADLENTKNQNKEEFNCIKKRLGEFSGDGGIPKVCMESLLSPFCMESLLSPIMTEISEKTVKILSHGIEAPLEELIEKGIISSSEEAAHLADKIKSKIASSKYVDHELTQLIFCLYLAFGRRRSLLLLNYGKQVQSKDLPWMNPALFSNTEQISIEDRSQETANLLFLSVMKAFPHVILPNMFIGKLKSILEGNKPYLPLTKELAADIFEGGFAPVFAHSAVKSANLLKGTLYERYFNLSGVFSDLSLDDSNQNKLDNFTSFCKNRSATSSSWFTTKNGGIIEQQQIITTHNLAALVSYFNLQDKIDWNTLAMKTWKFILKAVSNHSAIKDKPLPHQKNIAYAWRQLVFYLSFLPPERQQTVAKVMKNECSSKLKQEEAKWYNQMFIGPLEEAVKGNTPQETVLGWTINENGDIYF